MSEQAAGSLAFPHDDVANAAIGGPGFTVAVGEDGSDALSIGCFDRPISPPPLARPPAPTTFVRRETGGKSANVGPGLVRVLVRFAMDTPAPEGSREGPLFVPDAPRILNRAVRPLLRALRKLTPLVHYFGRDVISVRIDGARHDIAAVGFAHDGATGQGVLEALLSVRPGLSPRPDVAPLPDVLVGLPAGWERTLCDLISSSYEREGATRTALSPLPEVDASMTWDHTEVVPPVGMRVGVSFDPLSVGGDFFGSSDWLRAIGDALAHVPRPTTADAIRAVFDVASPSASGGVLLGIEGPHVLAEAIVTALESAGEFRDKTTV